MTSLTFFSWPTLPAPLVVVALGLFGVVIGSFLNVVIHRLPIMLGLTQEDPGRLGDVARLERGGAAERYDLVLPPSACPHCGHRLRWYENVPVISWLALRGRCSACRASIGVRYLLVECLAGVLPVLVAWPHLVGSLAGGLVRPTESLELAALALFTWCAIAIAVIDWRHSVIPDRLSLPLLWGGLLAAAAGVGVSAGDSILGAAIGFIFFFGVALVGERVAGRPALGHGDVKLLAAIGAWVGPWLLPDVLVLGCGAGSVCGLIMITGGWRRRAEPIPFGPFLLVGALAVLIRGRHQVPLLF